ncbi:MAG: hypothetical protein R3331_09325 [Sulfurospirillaceae bacterium]|nr:hypothetical protein [Sulfurospirillaceae bacterium]
MTQEEKKVLFAKFDEDVAKRSKAMRVLLVLDQTFNVLVWNGSQDETISSHIGRLKAEGRATWFDKKICCFLQKLEYNHCKNSEGE